MMTASVATALGAFSRLNNFLNLLSHFGDVGFTMIRDPVLRTILYDADSRECRVTNSGDRKYSFSECLKTPIVESRFRDLLKVDMFTMQPFLKLYTRLA